VLVGVAALGTLLLLGASRAFTNDWLAVVGCFAVLGLGAVALDVTGRRAAVVAPDPIYVSSKLPYERTRLKPFAVVATLIVLVVVVTASARPGKEASPFPFFAAAAFLYLVLPQLLARRAVRRARAGSLRSRRVPQE